MSYFFAVTAELVAPLRNEPRTPCDNCDSAIARTRANKEIAKSQKSQSGSFLNSADWHDFFEERAAIREHDGGALRADAEAGALADCVARWRALNPLPASGDGACVQCGKARPDTPLLARGGHAWLHRGCWARMNAAREAAAREALLTALGRQAVRGCRRPIAVTRE